MRKHALLFSLFLVPLFACSTKTSNPPGSNPQTSFDEAKLVTEDADFSEVWGDSIPMNPAIEVPSGAFAPSDLPPEIRPFAYVGGSGSIVAPRRFTEDASITTGGMCLPYQDQQILCNPVQGTKDQRGIPNGSLYKCYVCLEKQAPELGSWAWRDYSKTQVTYKFRPVRLTGAPTYLQDKVPYRYNQTQRTFEYKRWDDRGALMEDTNVVFLNTYSQAFEYRGVQVQRCLMEMKGQELDLHPAEIGSRKYNRYKIDALCRNDGQKDNLMAAIVDFDQGWTIQTVDGPLTGRIYEKIEFIRRPFASDWSLFAGDGKSRFTLNSDYHRTQNGVLKEQLLVNVPYDVIPTDIDYGDSSAILNHIRDSAVHYEEGYNLELPRVDDLYTFLKALFPF